MLLSLLLAPLLLSLPITASDECVKAGKCNGYLLWDIEKANLCDCYATCYFQAGCVYYTFDSQKGICSLFNSCRSLENCQNCQSGQVLCTPRDCGEGCTLEYKSLGEPLDTVQAVDACDCRDQCNNLIDCLYYTFDSRDNVCFFYNTMETDFEMCPSCQTGYYQCQPNC